MHNQTETLGLVIIIAVAGLLFYGQHLRARSIMGAWAIQNDYEILKCELRYLLRGPFSWTSSKGQFVYRVTIRDAQSQIRSGWVRCGGWWLGVASAKTEARWDE